MQLKTAFTRNIYRVSVLYLFQLQVHFNLSLHNHFIIHNSFTWYEESNVSTYLPRASIFQLEDIHGVVDPAAVVVELNIPGQTLYSNLQMEEKPL